ncbi:MAG: RNB domain-containing ribonuclease, partial [Phycisphaerae bacterium]
THYCHFTSPIRRYADLLVHRLLEYYLQNRLDAAKQISAEPDLAEIGKHLTFTEQRADDAENELKSVLILQMLSKRTGEELDCVVTGITNFGVFVQSRKFGIDGLIVMGDLGGDDWKYNQKAQCITGMRSGANIRLGKVIKVRIVSVNVPARQLNLVPVKLLATTAAKSPSMHRRREATGERNRRAKKSRRARHREKRR